MARDIRPRVFRVLHALAQLQVVGRGLGRDAADELHQPPDHQRYAEVVIYHHACSRGLRCRPLGATEKSLRTRGWDRPLAASRRPPEDDGFAVAQSTPGRGLLERLLVPIDAGDSVARDPRRVLGAPDPVAKSVRARGHLDLGHDRLEHLLGEADTCVRQLLPLQLVLGRYRASVVLGGHRVDLQSLLDASPIFEFVQRISFQATP
mmetsp:Transcript_6532/g.15468  ORF Transcript_6532/g.15468 Transcript_6532/m.15468 type:complete len:206 (+) Transcript_6532:736-1353(+)